MNITLNEFEIKELINNSTDIGVVRMIASRLCLDLYDATVAINTIKSNMKGVVEIKSDVVVEMAQKLPKESKEYKYHNKIANIKKLREATGLGLHASKLLVEAMMKP